jgi:AbrB family looped-hinge helix DNA binding protein
MMSVTVSAKFQVVIPQATRERLQIEAGRKLQVIAYDNRIKHLPIESATTRCGFVHGIDTSVIRDGDQVKPSPGVRYVVAKPSPPSRPLSLSPEP